MISDMTPEQSKEFWAESNTGKICQQCIRAWKEHDRAHIKQQFLEQYEQDATTVQNEDGTTGIRYSYYIELMPVNRVIH